MQPVPGLGGFTSVTGTSPIRKSTVDYFTPINQPITDNAVVRELLKRSEVATAEVGQYLGPEYIRSGSLYEGTTHNLAMAR